jgi:hypothetical protein
MAVHLSREVGYEITDILRVAEEGGELSLKSGNTSFTKPVTQNHDLKPERLPK